MTDFLIIKFLHIIGLAYWLGGDLGVFYSSYAVANDKLPPPVRTAAAKTLFALDQAPRLCMTLMLPLGLHLAWRLNLLPFGTGAMTAIWLAAAAWLGWVVYLHSGSNAGLKRALTVIDSVFRLSVSTGLIAIGGAALLSDVLVLPYWVAWKLIIFGALIGCGLIIRRVLVDFGPAFAGLAQGSPSAADNATIARSLARTRPFVVTIWLGLAASTALGIHLI